MKIHKIKYQNGNFVRTMCGRWLHYTGGKAHNVWAFVDCEACKKKKGDGSE